MTDVLLETSLDLPGRKSGKVRDIYDLGDRLLIVATDRISAFDCVLPNGIPHKGRVLTGMSVFWFRFFADRIPHHLLSDCVEEMDVDVPIAERDRLAGRAMLVKKAEVIPFECVVRGYLAGSGWREYREKGTVCGIALPAGLGESEKLPAPIFTPATKATDGHDVNVPFDEMERAIGAQEAGLLRERSLEVYTAAAAYLNERGLILSDTKFEWGRADGEVVLIDEVLTPDSSRFWPRDGYAPGGAQPSFDKQSVRDFLDGLDWNKEPPAPELPPEVVERTSKKYVEAYERVTGLKFHP